MAQTPLFRQHNFCQDGTHLILTNVLFDERLYAWYIFEIEVFQTNDIEGVLMTPPFEIYGPLDTKQEADNILQSLYEGHTRIDDPASGV